MKLIYLPWAFASISLFLACGESHEQAAANASIGSASAAGAGAGGSSSTGIGKVDDPAKPISLCGEKTCGVAFGSIGQATWSPDKQKLAFLTYSEEKNTSDLWVTDEGFTRFVHLDDDTVPPLAFSWSPDSAWVLFSSFEKTFNSLGQTLDQGNGGGTFQHVYTAKADGCGKMTEISTLPRAEKLYYYATWAPAGASILMQTHAGAKDIPQYSNSSDKAYAISPDGKNKTDLTLKPTEEACASCTFWWAPDGQHFLMLLIDRGTNHVSVNVLNANTTERVVLEPASPSPNTFSYMPQWAPDGQHLALERETKTPDGQEASPPEVFVMKRDGSGRAKLAFGTERLKSPFQIYWLPDSSRLVVPTASGKILVFRSDGTLAVDLTASLDPTETHELGIVELPVSPDGSRIAFVSTAPTGAVTVRVVDPDGSKLKSVELLTATQAACPGTLSRSTEVYRPATSPLVSWSPTGKKLAVGLSASCDYGSKPGPNFVDVVNADGSGRVSLFKSDGTRSWTGLPPWWFGDDRVLIPVSKSIYAVKTDGTGGMLVPNTELGQRDGYFGGGSTTVNQPLLLLREQDAAQVRHNKVSSYDLSTQAKVSLNAPPVKACP